MAESVSADVILEQPRVITQLTRWAVGTTNRAKIESVRRVAYTCFPCAQHEIISCAVESGVCVQPLSAEETQKGAIQRARHVLQSVPHAHYGVGLEGGIECISGEDGCSRYFECGWMAVIEQQSGRVGIGSSARFELSTKLMKPILEEGKELGDVIDALTGETDVRSGLGAMGVLTAGHLDRARAYEHGLLFALAPFLSDKKYWGE